MIKRSNFIRFTVIIIFFSLISVSSEIYASSKKDLVRITLNGYNSLRQDNYDEAHELFKKALGLAYRLNWPMYSHKRINKILPKCIEKHEYDWQNSDEQKILGLMQVYNSVKHYFGGFEIVPDLNWDELVIEFIPKVIEAKNIEEYYKLLLKLIANLNDNHTWIVLPYSIREKIDRPPVFIEYIEDKFVITKVKDTPEIKKQNIYAGLEIKKVNGILVREFFIKNKLPYMTLSKIQRERLYETYNLLSGERNTRVKVTVVDRSGKEREVVLVRNSKMYKKNEELPIVQVKELEPGIIYFNFKAFWPAKKVIQKFEQEFNKLDLSKIKGMIFDVRENSGGSHKTGDVIISHIIDNPFKAWFFKMKVKGPIDVISNPFLRFGAKTISWLFKIEWYKSYNKIKPCSGKRFFGPVVVLISRYTGSAAEQFVVAIRESKRAKIIGETTSGGTGDGVFTILPGYGKFKVCIGMGAYINGDVWQGTGIEPDIAVSRKVEDIYKGYDSVLAKGLEVLNELINKKEK